MSEINNKEIDNKEIDNREKGTFTIIKSRKTLVLSYICATTFMLLLTIGCLIYFDKLTAANENKLMGEKYKTYNHYYVLITNDRKSSFWQTVYEGAKEEAQKENSYIEMLGNNLSEEYSSEDLMQIAIDSKVDGIILEANESSEMAILINKANAAGIPVITALEDNKASTRKSFVGVNSYNLGRAYGEQVCGIEDMTSNNSNDLDGTTVMVLMKANADDTSQNIIFTGISDAIKNSANKSRLTNVEAVAISNDGAFAAEESIRDIFMNQENIPDIIICMNELNTTCVYQAVVDYNKVGKINIIGYYDSDTICRAIERNVIYATISVNTKQLGMNCVSALDEYKESGHVSEYFSVDILLITSDNVSEYLGDADEPHKE